MGKSTWGQGFSSVSAGDSGCSPRGQREDIEARERWVLIHCEHGECIRVCGWKQRLKDDVRLVK